MSIKKIKIDETINENIQVSLKEVLNNPIKKQHTEILNQISYKENNIVSALQQSNSIQIIEEDENMYFDLTTFNQDIYLAGRYSAMNELFGDFENNLNKFSILYGYKGLYQLAQTYLQKETIQEFNFEEVYKIFKEQFGDLTKEELKHILQEANMTVNETVDFGKNLMNLYYLSGYMSTVCDNGILDDSKYCKQLSEDNLYIFRNTYFVDTVKYVFDKLSGKE